MKYNFWIIRYTIQKQRRKKKNNKFKFVRLIINDEDKKEIEKGTNLFIYFT